MTEVLNAKIATIINNTTGITITDSRQYYQSTDALPLLVINTPYCQAVIALQGAQLLTFQPSNDKPWLWLSPYETFTRGKAIRGGIPVCLPWFGVNQLMPSKPKHGFLRNQDWQLLEITPNDDSLTLCFGFSYIGEKPDLFIHPFSATLTMTLSQSLIMTLTLQNNSTESVDFSWALHSYFAVDDLSQAVVSGLNGLSFLDNTNGLKPTLQKDNIIFAKEVDRVFNNTVTAQTIQAHHALTIAGENCPSCIVWNPGESVAHQLVDVKDSYQQYLCVERGCVFADTLHLAAHATFSSSMTINKSL